MKTRRWLNFSRVCAAPLPPKMRPLILIARLGEGKGGISAPSSPAVSVEADDYGFAPRGPSTLHSRIRDRLPQPLRIRANRHGSVARIHLACSVRRTTASPLYIVPNQTTESSQLSPWPRRQRTLPRALPLPRSRLPTAGRTVQHSNHNIPQCEWARAWP